jgi:hypothetical protein
VRKTLGQHEIATLQTTAIDQTAGMVNLAKRAAIMVGRYTHAHQFKVSGLLTARL